MNKIQVAILHESHEHPAGMMTFLAKLTQRGHNIKDMDDLKYLYTNSVHNRIASIVDLPHGTIKRFTPITIAIVGASRRFLAQARTHQVGINFVSASLQYSNYTNKADFVVPYELLGKKNIVAKDWYLKSCQQSMETYRHMTEMGISNDTAGYAAPQGLRNILIMQGNHEALMYFIRTRTCRRNTAETRYVATLIWRELLKTREGDIMFSKAGPDCLYGVCREGNMSCNAPLWYEGPTDIIENTWPEVQYI